jgi:NAD(P)H-hydrate epimerase
MKIPAAADIRNWDQYTITHEPIASIDLMERAASACTKWLLANFPNQLTVHIFCGKGNNGGDGLAIARLLSTNKIHVVVHILEFGHLGTDDFQANLAALHQHPDVVIKFIQSKENFPTLSKDDLIVDALLGTGLNRSLESVTKDLVNHLNSQSKTCVSIDVPSGMFADSSSKGNTIVKADHTLSFQCYKYAFLVAENAEYIGELEILSIGLHIDFYESIRTEKELVDDEIVHNIFRKRSQFSHKGDFGHAILFAGSYGKTGAAILAARACLRSGAGLLTCHIPASAYSIMQTAVPEAMVSTDYNSSYLTKYESDFSRLGAIAVGPGIGTASETRNFISELLNKTTLPIVIDADALNILSIEKQLLNQLPPECILTPHPKEFERIFGSTKNEFERNDLAVKMANELNVVIILKGHHSLIAIPGSNAFFNATGNAGMATAGSGDVLTGILLALLSQGYTAANAAVLGVYLHGLAGDIAAAALSMESVIAGDIIKYLGAAFKSLGNPNI